MDKEKDQKHSIRRRKRDPREVKGLKTIPFFLKKSLLTLQSHQWFLQL